MWVDVVICCITFNFPPPLQVKNQHLTVLNKRRCLEWCTSMLDRLGERRRLWEIFRKTHISRRLGVILS